MAGSRWRKVWTWLRCHVLRDHDWTNAYEETGRKPTEAEAQGGIAGFYTYASMYCRDCRKVSKLSSNAIDAARERGQTHW